MAVVRKKIWPEYFALLESGKKRFELRLADFDIKEGDTLVLEEWDSVKKEYTGKSIRKEVDFVLKCNLDDFWQGEKMEKYGFYVIQF